MESVAGIVFSSDRTEVLLILRRDVPVWVLPGGGIDPGETAEQAVLREILEETGFQVKIDSLIGTYFPANRLTKNTALYSCSLIGGTAQISAETKGVRFFPLASLPQMPPPYPEWIEDSLRANHPIRRRLDSVNYTTLFRYLLTHPILVIRFLLARMGMSINDS